MTELDYSLLRRVVDGGLEGLLSEAAERPATLVELTDEIHGLDPFVDAEQLADLRAELGLAVIAARDTDAANADLRLEAARLLLERVVGRQSPVGSDLRLLLDRQPHRFTPALLRTVWRTNERPWSLPELRCVAEESAWAFLTGELAQLGVVSRTTDELEDFPEPRYRLMPAGRQALPAIARRVLEFELGRFPWPKDMTDPKSWASDTQLRLLQFLHLGDDGATLARFLGKDPQRIGSLSLPNLVGVARQEPRADSELLSIALMRGEADEWTPKTVKARTDQIVDDHMKLMQRSDMRLDDGELKLFVLPTLARTYGPVMRDACQAATVECSFVN